MFTSFVQQFKTSVVEPAVNRRMDEVGKAWVAEASRLAPVDTGALRSHIGYAYDASTKRLVLFCNSPYALFQELGWRMRNGQHHPAHPFMRPALSVVPRIWRGSLGNALTGHSVELQGPSVAAKYHAGIEKSSKGKLKGSRLKLGHGKFA